MKHHERRCPGCGLAVGPRAARQCWACGVDVPPVLTDRVGTVVEQTLAALCAVVLMLVLLLGVLPAHLLAPSDHLACPRERSVAIAARFRGVERHVVDPACLDRPPTP